LKKAPAELTVICIELLPVQKKESASRDKKGAFIINFCHDTAGFA